MRLAFAASLGALALAAMLAGGSSADRGACLAVLSGAPPKRIVCVPVGPGEEFELQFENSIYHAPVRERFIYEPGKGIVLVGVVSPSAGVFEYYGLAPGAGGNGSGSAALRRVIGEMRLLSHDYSRHVVRIGGRSISLKGLVLDGAPAKIRVDTSGSSGP